MVCSSLLKIAAHQWLTSPIHLKSNVTQYCGYDCTDIRPVDTDIDTYYHLIFIVHSWTLIFKIRALILKGTCCIYLYLSCTFFSLLQNDIHIWNVYYTLNIPWMLESIKHLKYTFHKAWKWSFYYYRQVHINKKLIRYTIYLSLTTLRSVLCMKKTIKLIRKFYQ